MSDKQTSEDCECPECTKLRDDFDAHTAEYEVYRKTYKYWMAFQEAVVKVSPSLERCLGKNLGEAVCNHIEMLSKERGILWHRLDFANKEIEDFKRMLRDARERPVLDRLEK